MSTNVNKFVLDIAEKLDYATADIYLLQQGVLTAEEFASFQKALQNGSLINGDVVRKLLPRILKKPREFYRALRQHVQHNHNVHAGNMELFHMLPEYFGKKGFIKSALRKFKSKNKSPISTIVEDPVSSSDTDKYLQVGTLSPTEGHASSDEEESDYEMSSTYWSLGLNNRIPSTQSLYTPRMKKKSLGKSLRQLSESSYHQQSTTSRQTLTSSNHHFTRKRSASVSENLLACNMKAHSLSELHQPKIVSQEFKALTPIPKPRRIKPFPQATANSATTEKHRNRQSDIPTDDDNASFEASGYGNLQQQLENSLKESIGQLQQQLQQQLESSLIEKAAKIQSELQKMLIIKSQENVIQLQRELKQYKSGYNQNETEKQKAAETEEALAQASAEVQEKAKEIVALKESLQSMVQKLKVADSDYDGKLTEHTKEIQKYRKLYDAEKDNTVKARKSLTQLSTELQEKAKETRESQLMVQRLKEALKQSKIDYDNKITELTKESQKYRDLCDAEKQNTVKTQEHLTQVSTELHVRTQETLALKKEQHEMQSTIQKLENTLRDFTSEHGSESTKEIQKYKKLYEVQCDTLSQVSAELQEKSQETQALKKEQRELQSTIQKLENSLRDFKSKITEYSKEVKKHSDNKNEDIVKAQEALKQVSTELQEKEKECLALKQSHSKLLCAKQNIEKQLQDVSNQYELYIKEREDFKHIQVEKENATKKLLEVFSENTDLRELQSALQNKNTSLIQEKEDLECAIKSLQDENDTLKVTNEELNNRLAQSTKEPPASPLSPIKHKTHVPSQNSGKLSKDKGTSSNFLTQTPKLWRLKRDVFPKIMDHWKDVALHSLCYDASKIAEIEKAGPSDSQRCCTTLFKDWLEANKDVTWRTLITQLRKVEKLDDKIEEIIKQLNK